MRTSSILITSCLLVLATSLPRALAAPEGLDIDLVRSSIDCGGGTSADPDYTVRGTFGEPDAAELSGAMWTLRGGFASRSNPPTCPADLDGSGAVDFGDILSVLGAWGPCPPECPEDLDSSGEVDFGDLLVILSSWGACP